MFLNKNCFYCSNNRVFKWVSKKNDSKTRALREFLEKKYPNTRVFFDVFFKKRPNTQVSAHFLFLPGTQVSAYNFILSNTQVFGGLFSDKRRKTPVALIRWALVWLMGCRSAAGVLLIFFTMRGGGGRRSIWTFVAFFDLCRLVRTVLRMVLLFGPNLAAWARIVGTWGWGVVGCGAEALWQS